MSSPTPVAEVKRAKQGDEQAFATLYQLRAGEVYRYERSLLRDHTAAEDVTAQTFLQAWESLSKLRRLDRFDAWLFRIAHNVAMTELRRTRTTALDDAPEPADPSRFHNPETLLQGSIDAATVRAALARLPDAMREVLVLRFYVGLSHAEVATHIGRKESHVRVIQFRALRYLRETLEQSDVPLPS